MFWLLFGNVRWDQGWCFPLCSFNHISLFSFIWLQHSGKRYKYGTKIKAESLVQRVRKPCIYFDLWVQLLTVFLFLKRRNLIHSIFKPNKNADLYQKCTCLKLFLFWEKKKKRDDPVSSAVPWGSAETETGLKGLAACVGGGPLCYVLDLFKGNRVGEGNACCIFMNYDSCLFSECSA